ncbi:MAG: hypothetical protein IJ224_07030 [Lachnospiraceae bacterium]|nr:hypothetical protein [Lachnospiraceae bacterium]
MQNLMIKFDFSHGPIWKEKYNIDTGEWSTGIDVIDKDKALSILDDEANKEYSSLYSFDENGTFIFDTNTYEKKKDVLLSLIQTIVLRVNDLNDGSYTVIDEETPKLTK